MSKHTPYELKINEYGSVVIDCHGNPIHVACGNKEFLRECVEAVNSYERLKAKEAMFDELVEHTEALWNNFKQQTGFSDTVYKGKSIKTVLEKAKRLQEGE